MAATAATGLLANDTDPNPMDVLSVFSATDSTGAIIPVNPVGILAPISHSTPNGTITLFSDGSFDFVPDANWSGMEFINPGLLLVTPEQLWAGGISQPRNPAQRG